MARWNKSSGAGTRETSLTCSGRGASSHATSQSDDLDWPAWCLISHLPYNMAARRINDLKRVNLALQSAQQSHLIASQHRSIVESLESWLPLESCLLLLARQRALAQLSLIRTMILPCQGMLDGHLLFYAKHNSTQLDREVLSCLLFALLLVCSSARLLVCFSARLLVCHLQARLPVCHSQARLAGQLSAFGPSTWVPSALAVRVARREP